MRNRYINTHTHTHIIVELNYMLSLSLLQDIDPERHSTNKLLLNPQYCDTVCDIHVKYYFY